MIEGQYKVGLDPVAQTFQVPKSYVPGSDGLFLGSLDLFFGGKREVGASVWIASCNNGVPVAGAEVPGSRIHLSPAQINITSNGQKPTRVIFDGPVYIKAGTSYAICIQPDGGNPDLKIWYAEQGEKDIYTGTVIPSNWSLGSFFVSAAGAWEPKIDYDLKFNIYQLVFREDQTGTINMVPDNYEFLTVNTVTGAFSVAEEAYLLPGVGTGVTPTSFANGTIAATEGNLTVTGTSTVFSQSFSAGDTIVLYQSNTVSDVVTIDSIQSNTSMTLKGGPIRGITGNAALVPTGIVEKYDTANGIVSLVLSGSTAKSGVVFQANAAVVGVNSGAVATISSIDAQPINYFQPHIGRTTPTGTSVTSTFKVTNKDNINDTKTKRLYFGSNQQIPDFEAGIHSRSNEIVNNSGNRSFVVETKLFNNSKFASPTVDEEVTMLQGYNNIINNVNTNERVFGQGQADAKYLSKAVQLASGLEAEDLNVYVSAYRPANTTIEVYAKMVNAADSDKLLDRQWTKLIEDDSQKDLFSSEQNVKDIREFKFTVPSHPTADGTNVQPGTANCNTSSVTVLGNGSNFTSGDIIVITDGTFDVYSTGRVSSANATHITLNSIPDNTITNGNFYKVKSDEVRSAFKQTIDNGNTFRLRYFDGEGREFQSYGNFQIKVVLLSEQTRRVPRIADVRAIALSA